MSGENDVMAGRTDGRPFLSLAQPAVTALLAVGGMAVASYLAYGSFGDKSLFCELGHGCDAVEASEYSIVLGVPVAVWGGLLYMGTLAAAVSVLLVSDRRGELLSYIILGMALCGTVYPGYLAWVEIHRIESVCMWCTASAVIVTAIFVLAGVSLAFGTRGRPDRDVSDEEVFR